MNQNKANIITGILLIVIASVMKAVTYPFSINPIIAISLFSGAVIADKKYAFAIPLLSMFASDLILEVFNIAPGFYGMSQLGNYASLLLVTILGFGMKKINPISIAGFSIASSLLFFFLSNTNCFFFDTENFYGIGFNGWVKCLAAGLPFVKNGIVTDLGFSVILFGVYSLAIKYAAKKAVA